MPTRFAATLYGLVMVALAAIFHHGRTWPVQTPVRLVAGAAVVGAIVLGVRRFKPRRTGTWQLLAVTLVLSAAGTAGFTSPVPWLHTTGTWVLLGVYPLLALVLLGFVRLRTGGVPDRGSLLDALTVTSGVTLLAWTYAIGPHFRHLPLHTADQWFAVAFPVGDLLCLGMLIRLLTTYRRRVPAVVLLSAGIVAMLAADVGYNLVELRGDLELLAAVGRIPLYAAAGLAVLHPSMLELTRRGPGPATEFSKIRLLLLAGASLIAPTVLVTQVGTGRPYDLPVIAGLSAVTFLLVLARMAGIMANHRLAIARERGLRVAAAAMVSAADADAVAVAVRAAVAGLMPPDAPHGVVLTMAVSGHVESRVESGQAELDRAAGTVARMMPTRDVDWATSVRLNQFSTVLRCPLVLPDRPTGDPLVGVLTVGGPAAVLTGLQPAVEVLAAQIALALERIELSEEVTRRNSETYFRTLVQNTSDVILIVDEYDRVAYASPSAGPVLGGDPVGASLAQVIHPSDQERLGGLLAAIRLGQAPTEGLDFRGRTDVMLELHCRDLRADLTVAGLVITMRDVTERRRLERELMHQAFHDSLTGLANRVLYTDRLEHALHRGARDGSTVGVLFIDLDDFKIVNDTLGHAVGDRLLMAVADRISGALRADDTAARLGGDEFAALVENVQDPGAVEETANRILAALAEPIRIDDQLLYAVASIGITTTPEADTAAALLRQADLALYVAKGAGKNQWRRYQSHLHSQMVERLELRSALDHAVNEGSFVLQYQPIVDLVTDEAVGFEALVRWQHPVRGVIAPDQFIEVAEESGLIVPLGRWVLDQALHAVAQWRRIASGRPTYVSVNVSVRQFRESGFVDQVRAALRYVDVPAAALMLEITETLLAGDDERIWADLVELRAMGVRIAIDDFGTGYSSLGYLRQRPIDVVKIDKKFIDDIVGDEQQHALVAGIVGLARSLHLTVVAEGIETTLQRDVLTLLGCPLGQGFLYSSPVGAAEALAWLARPQVIAA